MQAYQRRSQRITVDRNIVTQADVIAFELSSSSRSGADSPVKAPTVDDYLSKLLKQVPLEIIGAYLILEGFIKTGLVGQPLVLR